MVSPLVVGASEAFVVGTVFTPVEAGCAAVVGFPVVGFPMVEWLAVELSVVGFILVGFPVLGGCVEGFGVGILLAQLSFL